ncbi:MAG: hypothetical protein IJA03_02435 [Bacteroidaceae bacterium]|nr:hypothetical protein [Bacteroidaceae bacterium]
MKKNYFLLAMAAGMMSFASCSSDDAVNGSEEWADGDQVIMLDMQDTDVLASRSRPLYSTANMGAEKVTDVKLLVFKIDGSTNTKTLTKEFNISNWNNESSDYQYGRQYTYRIPKADRLESGKYTIVAVGQDEATGTVAPYTWGTPATTLPLLDITDGLTWNSATTPGYGFAGLIPNAVATDADPAEIFSGQSQPVTIGTDGEAFTATVLLKRQVAGVLGYFDRIPAEVNSTPVTNIRLVASKKNTKLDLTINLEDQNDDTTGNDPIECVVNGFTSADYDAKFEYLGSTVNDANVVYDIDLTEWFTGWNNTTGWDGSTKLQVTTESGDQLDILNPTAWKNAIDATNAEVKVADGAVMAGKFMIPFEKFYDAGFDKQTFELQLLNVNGGTTTILKAWRVKLDAGSQNAELGDGPYVYNIYRNHLYQIGQRGNGDNPNNPGEGGDDPQPLDKINEQELVIKINDQWEFIHNMEIE